MNIRLVHRLIAASCAVVLCSTVGIPAGRAGDPFRSSNPQPISASTAAAFTAAFQQGNYPAAEQALQQALRQDSSDPLVFALAGSLAFAQQNRQAFADYARQTKSKAQAIAPQQPLRSQLYIAVGELMMAASTLLPQLTGDGGVPLAAVPQALQSLQTVYGSLRAAAQINPNDPELNLVQGFVDLIVATNLPLANPSGAIAKLEKASPRYLADRGIALGLRNLKRYPEAIQYVDRAIAAAPENPELRYLKAQILVEQSKATGDANLRRAAAAEFQKALAKSSQLPQPLVWQLFFEACNNQKTFDNRGQDCVSLRDQVTQAPGPWGPATLPDRKSVV